MNRFAGSFHHTLKLSHFINSQCQPRKSNKHITGTAFKPGIAGKNIRLLVLFVEELMSCIYQAMLKIITRGAFFHFLFKGLLQRSCTCFRNTSRKYNAFTLLDIYFKIPRNIEILIKVVTSFLFFRILYTTIPVRLEMKLILFIKLHKEFGISRIHTCLYTIIHFLIITTCLRIFMCILADTTESQKRTKTESSGRMSFD